MDTWCYTCCTLIEHMLIPAAEHVMAEELVMDDYIAVGQLIFARKSTRPDETRAAS